MRGNRSFRMLTKSTDWQSVEKARKQGNFAAGKICRRRRLDLTIPKGSANPPQGSKLASKEAYMDVSDRRMQVQLTQEARIASDFSYIRAILAVVGFVSALAASGLSPWTPFFVPAVSTVRSSGRTPSRCRRCRRPCTRSRRARPRSIRSGTRPWRPFAACPCRRSPGRGRNAR